MKLWETRRDRYTKVSKSLQNDLEEWKQHWLEDPSEMGMSMNDTASAKMLFEVAHQEFIAQQERRLKELPDSDSDLRAQFRLLMYGSTFNLDWVLCLLEGVNDRITIQRDLMLEMVNAVKQRNDAKLDDLSKKLSEIPKVDSKMLETLGRFQSFYDRALKSERGVSYEQPSA